MTMPIGIPDPATSCWLSRCADTSLRSDRGFKKMIYAKSSLPVYWIVNLIDRRVEVYSDPTGPAERPDYRRHDHFSEAESVPSGDRGPRGWANFGYVSALKLYRRILRTAAGCEHGGYIGLEGREQYRRGCRPRPELAMHMIGRAFECQHKDRFGFRVDDPVFGNAGLGIFLAFRFQVASPRQGIALQLGPPKPTQPLDDFRRHRPVRRR